MNTMLITFGCSWTHGVGVGYNPGLSKEDYLQIAWDNIGANEHSFRGLLSQRYNLKNLNFSSGGSSNQRQFRLAEDFFSSSKFKEVKKTYDKIIVLWGITSIYRTEVYCVQSKNFINLYYNGPKTLSKELLVNHFDHNVEIELLSKKINFWNTFFDSIGVSNLWFDTFNHHDYQDLPFPDRLFNKDSYPRDLLSQLAIQHGMSVTNNNYHMSNWEVDSDRITFLVERGILNPYSHHPTKQGHKCIADMLAPALGLV